MGISSSHSHSLVSSRDESQQPGGMVQKIITSSTAAVLLFLIQMSLACEPRGLPPLVDDHRSHDKSEELVNFLVPSYQFSCHGLVVSWSACVDPGGDRERYEIHFQVWRPSGDGCFNLVGVNVPSELLAPDDHCVEYHVPVEQQIQVLPGDVMGFYVDRYKLSRRGNDLENPMDGGVQLNTDWSESVTLLSPGSGEYLVGAQFCNTQEISLGAAPVLSASVVPVPLAPPLSSSPAGPPEPSSTSSPPSSSSTSLFSPPPSSSLLALDATLSPSLSQPTISQMAPSSTPLPEHSSHNLALSETIPSPMTSSALLMTSSPTQRGEIPAVEGGLPPLLIGGIFMSAILIIAITSLAVVLVTMCLWKPRSVKSKVDHEEGDMMYSEAYEAHSSTAGSNSDSPPQVLGLVWNKAYNRCTMLDKSPEPEHRNRTEAAEYGPGNDLEMKELPDKLEKEVIYDEVSDFHIRSKYADGHTPLSMSCNEYEEVF